MIWARGLGKKARRGRLVKVRWRRAKRLWGGEDASIKMVGPSRFAELAIRRQGSSYLMNSFPNKLLVK